MPRAQPTLSTWISWPSPTGSITDVRGAKGSPRRNRCASASGAIVGWLQRAAGEIAVEEAGRARRRLRFRLLEDLLMHRRQRAGGIGVAGGAPKCKGRAAAAAEIDLLVFAGTAGLRHPARAAIAVEGVRV